MFRVEFFCDDKNVGIALRRLVGVAVGKPEATPVVNAENVNGAMTQITSSGSLSDQFTAYLRKAKMTEISIRDVREFIESTGAGSPSSAGHVLQSLRERKMIKIANGSPKAGYRVRYSVLPSALHG
jgi:hypothetical protein